MVQLLRFRRIFHRSRAGRSGKQGQIFGKKKHGSSKDKREGDYRPSPRQDCGLWSSCTTPWLLLLLLLLLLSLCMDVVRERAKPSIYVFYFFLSFSVSFSLSLSDNNDTHAESQKAKTKIKICQKYLLQFNSSEFKDLPNQYTVTHIYVHTYFLFFWMLPHSLSHTSYSSESHYCFLLQLPLVCQGGWKSRRTYIYMHMTLTFTFVRSFVGRFCSFILSLMHVLALCGVMVPLPELPCLTQTVGEFQAIVEFVSGA